ncbi:MAG: cytidylate kinase-like family protein [Oscillospiraceae bacterium]|nr:cytidylate kinase-like family protein [Oscillospiraceae bacterium]
MNKRILTISREFGSGGRYLGETVAKRLGIAYYDKAIIAKIAEETGLAKEFIEEKGEYAPTAKIPFAYSLVGRSADGSSIEDYLYAVQRKIILEAAEKGPCVIIGRSANDILRDRSDCIHVFVCGNMEAKIARIQNLYHKTEAEAKKLIHDTDKKRSINYRYYTEQQWGLAKNYTITLNSTEIGFEKCADILQQLYQA